MRVFHQVLPGDDQLARHQAEQRLVGFLFIRVNLLLQNLKQAQGFDARRQAKFAVGIQQIDLPDFFQVQPHRVFGQLHRDHGGVQQIQRFIQVDFAPILTG